MVGLDYDHHHKLSIGTLCTTYLNFCPTEDPSSSGRKREEYLRKGLGMTFSSFLAM